MASRAMAMILNPTCLGGPDKGPAAHDCPHTPSSTSVAPGIRLLPIPSRVLFSSDLGSLANLPPIFKVTEVPE